MSVLVEVSKEDFQAHVARHDPNVHVNVALFTHPPVRRFWDTTREPSDPAALIATETLCEELGDGHANIYRIRA